MLVRTHLLCPYSDCLANHRDNDDRVRALIDEERNVVLEKSSSLAKSARTKLSYKGKLWAVPQVCPFCSRKFEVVIDETHEGRNISLRLPR